jgi:hypothetical protein
MPKSGIRKLSREQWRFAVPGEKSAPIDEVEVHRFLDQQGLPNGLTLKVLGGGNALVAIIPEVDSNGKNWFPARLDAIQEAFSARFGIDLEILRIPTDFENGTREDLEAGLRGYLNQRFSRLVENCRISSTSGGKFDVFLEPEIGTSREMSRITRMAVEYAVSEFLSFLGLRPARVHWTASLSHTPSLIVLLAAVKSTAPANLESIDQALRERDYPSTKKDWLRRKLDLLRKRGLVVRSQEGWYTLTERALAVLPVRNSRASSDVTRALALGRKTWVG